MQVSITYCTHWNYLPRASGLGAAISRELGIQAELREGTAGVFDVLADGALVFSKHREGRFPADSEILDALRARTA